MRVLLSDKGDSSVGIHPNFIDLYVNWDYPREGKDREDLRSDIVKMAKEYFDFGSGIHIRFSDECMECGKMVVEDVMICPLCAAQDLGRRL